VASLKKSARPFFCLLFFKVKLLLPLAKNKKKSKKKKRRVGFYKKKGAELFTFAKKPGCLNLKEHNVLFFLEIYFKIMLGLVKKILWT
jgi:hypothetical protein